MPLIDFKNEIVYYLPRKIGSSTIELIFEKLLDKESIEFSKKIYKHANPSVFKYTKIEKFKKVIFLRDPLDQTMSWFFWQLRDLKLENNEIIEKFNNNYKTYFKSNDEFYKFEYDIIFYFENYRKAFRKFLIRIYGKRSKHIFRKIFNQKANELNKRNITDQELKKEIINNLTEDQYQFINDYYKEFDLFKNYIPISKGL